MHTAAQCSPWLLPPFLARTARIKAHELRGKSKQELLAQVRLAVVWDAGVAGSGQRSLMPALSAPCTPQLKDLQAELAALRVAKVTGGAPNTLSKM